jgi:anaerobic nitric oxide reductase transcription regulator
VQGAAAARHLAALGSAPVTPGAMAAGAAGVAPPAPGPQVAPMREAVQRYERELVQAALAAHGGNAAAAARALGLDRANLARLARRLGLAPTRGRVEAS